MRKGAYTIFIRVRVHEVSFNTAVNCSRKSNCCDSNERSKRFEPLIRALMYAVVLLESASGRDLSSCNCPPRCSNDIHKATVSSSRLSGMMINYYLSRGSNDSELDRRYVNAVETRSRVGSSLLSEILSHLERVITAYQRLKAMLEVDLIEHTTSVPGQIHASISTIVQQTQNSLEEFNSQIAQKFTDYYEQNVDFSVTQLVDSAKSILGNRISFTDISENDTDSFNISRNKKIFDYGNAFCKNLDTLKDYVYVSNLGVNFSTKLFVDRTCRNWRFRYCFFANSGLLTINNTGELMTESARGVVKCVPMYHTFLSEVQSWMKRILTMNSSLSLQPADHRNVLKELEHKLNWLKSTFHTFAEQPMVISFSTTIFHY